MPFENFEKTTTTLAVAGRPVTISRQCSSSRPGDATRSPLSFRRPWVMLTCPARKSCGHGNAYARWLRQSAPTPTKCQQREDGCRMRNENKPHGVEAPTPAACQADASCLCSARGRTCPVLIKGADASLRFDSSAALLRSPNYLGARGCLCLRCVAAPRRGIKSCSLIG